MLGSQDLSSGVRDIFYDTHLTNATYTICGFAVLTILSTKQCDVYQTFGQTADVIVDIKVDVIDTIGLKSLLVFAQKFGLQDWQEVCNITY